jgi:hypothetical protein
MNSSRCGGLGYNPVNSVILAHRRLKMKIVANIPEPFEFQRERLRKGFLLSPGPRKRTKSSWMLLEDGSFKGFQWWRSTTPLSPSNISISSFSSGISTGLMGKCKIPD